MRFSLTLEPLSFYFSLPRLLLVATAMVAMPGCGFAESGTSAPAVVSPVAELPDAPSASLTSSSRSSADAIDGGASADLNAFGGQATSAVKPMAPAYVKLIVAGQAAPKQTATDKVVLGLRESVLPSAMAGWVISAGWSQLIDSSPNYGTNGKAFAQRLGAAAALRSSREIFSDSVLSIAFHQDPRYYQLGSSHRLVNRVVYAVTRPLIGRTDGGRTIPNYAFILGTGGASALTHTYYPEINVTPGQVMQTWGTSLGGIALGYLVSEFRPEIKDWIHLRKHE
jgi:hypothetical protein